MMGLRDPTSPRFILWLSRARGAIMHPKIIKGRPCVWPRDHGHKQTRAHYDETQPLTAGPTSVKPPAAALLTSLLTTP